MHKPVLLQTLRNYLDIQPGDVVVDGTINGGGHAEDITNLLGNQGVFIGFDVDQKAIAATTRRLKNTTCAVNLFHKNFRDIKQVFTENNLPAPNKAYFDLGWSTNQFEDPKRGFSFRYDGPLNMTLSGQTDEGVLTAFDVVNHWEESSLADILYGFADERFSRRIAAAIVAKRQDGAIQTTLELAEIVTQAIPARFRPNRIHPATKTFQAIRMAVNDEIGAIKEGLHETVSLLASGGILAVITFHSVEDRAVKRLFKDLALGHIVKPITKKPVVATQEELKENPKARSAKLRVVQKI